MENTPNQEPGNKWLSVPIIATITRLLCRELTLQNEYLLRENKILKSNHQQHRPRSSLHFHHPNEYLLLLLNEGGL